MRYGVYVHAGMPDTEELAIRWKEFADLDLQHAFAKNMSDLEALLHQSISERGESG